MCKKAVKVKKNGKPKIVDAEAYAAYNDGLVADIAAGTLVVVDDTAEAQAEARARIAESSDACIECCGEGNVRLCGQFVALCDSGESCVLGV